MKKISVKILSALSVILFAASLLSILSKYNIVFGIFSIFNFQYLLISLIILPILVLTRSDRWVKIITTATIILNFLILIPYHGLEECWGCSGGGQISVLSINVSESTGAYDNLIDYLENNDIDIVLIQELRQDLIDLLDERLSEKYEYSYYVPSRFTLGLGFLSKLPLNNPQTVNFETEGFSRKYIQAEVEKDGNKFNIINLHTLPPTRLNWFDQKNNEIEEYIDIVSNNNSYIAVGDFNTTPWAYPINSIRNKSANLAGGSLLDSTWKILGGLIKIPYDYAIYSDNLSVRNFRVVNDFGSDHLPIFMSISQ